MTSDEVSANLYPFDGLTGYLIHPQKSDAAAPIALGHTASVSSWQDADVHLHEVATEIFILLHGRLLFLIGETALNLHPGELLLVRSNVPHAIIGGSGRIEHFGLRAPAVDDRQSLGHLPSSLPTLSQETPRELRREWGYRARLSDDGDHNCWLLGADPARLACDHLSLSYCHSQTTEAAADLHARDRLHAHTSSWEYYLVLQGSMTLQADTRPLTVEAGHILEVPPGVCHALRARRTPFADFTIRVPLALDDKQECEAA